MHTLVGSVQSLQNCQSEGVRDNYPPLEQCKASNHKQLVSMSPEVTKFHP